MFRLPPFNALRAFEATARLGSVTVAARELCVTPSAVSHQIRALEEWLGVSLLDRSGRKLALTAAGRSYLPTIAAGLAEIAGATESLSRGRDAAAPHGAVAENATLPTRARKRPG